MECVGAWMYVVVDRGRCFVMLPEKMGRCFLVLLSPKGKLRGFNMSLSYTG